MLDTDTRVLLSMSGKGGVGKTLLAVGLAAALSKRARVGVLDLDIRSPNLTYVLGSDNTVEIDEQGHPLPRTVALDGSSVSVFSSAMMFHDGTAILTEGRQVRNLIAGMLFQVKWPELDFLVVDMDPSSGDSLIQVTESMGDVSAFVITTSDVSSLQDCRRMLEAGKILGIRVNGIVGNMIGVECPACNSALECRHCGTAVTFGDVQPVVDLALEFGVPYLGSLPWNPRYKYDPVRSVQGMGHRLFETLVNVALADRSVKKVVDG